MLCVIAVDLIGVVAIFEKAEIRGRTSIRDQGGSYGQVRIVGWQDALERCDIGVPMHYLRSHDYFICGGE